MQLALLVVLVVLITIAGTLFEERGVILTMIILVYALTSVVGGYASGSHYSRSDGQVWNPHHNTRYLISLSTIILKFALTPVVGGYASSRHYNSADGKVQQTWIDF